MSLLADCCALAVCDLLRPWVGQYVQCEKNHHIVFTEDGWRAYKHSDGSAIARGPAAPYSSFDVCTLAGCTYRQLHFWRAKGWIKDAPTEIGNGYSARFTEAQLHRVKELTYASKLKAMPMPELADELKALRAMHDWLTQARRTETVNVQGSLL